jgi:NADH:ubiquinone oxidoreductase subunit 4 (subunit M)
VEQPKAAGNSLSSIFFHSFVSFTSLIPCSLHLNGSESGLAIDSANVVFVLLVQLLFPLTVWLGSFESKTISFSLLFDNLLFVNIFILFCLSNMLLFFVLFELLVIVLFILLLLFLQSYY